MDRPDVSREAYVKDMDTWDHVYIVDLNDLPGVEEKTEKLYSSEEKLKDEHAAMRSYQIILRKNIKEALSLKSPDNEYKRGLKYLYENKIFDERRAYENYKFMYEIFEHHSQATKFVKENNLSKKRIYWCIPDSDSSHYIW